MIRFENIFAYLYDTRNRLKRAKKEASIKRATLEFALYGLNLGVLTSVGVVVLMQDLHGGVGAGKALWNSAQAVWALGPVILLVIPLIGALVSILSFYLACIFMTVLGRMMGGEGTLKQNAYLVSRLIFPFSIVTIAVGFLSQIPVIGFLFPIVWTLYALWIWVNMINVGNHLAIDKSAVILSLMVVAGAIVASLLNLGGTA